MIDKPEINLPTTYEALAQLQHEFQTYQQQGFPERGPHFFALELNGEAGELANLEKKDWKGKAISHDDLADEAADVFIALMNYANSRNINLAESVRNKVRKIEEKRSAGGH